MSWGHVLPSTTTTTNIRSRLNAVSNMYIHSTYKVVVKHAVKFLRSNTVAASEVAEKKFRTNVSLKCFTIAAVPRRRRKSFSKGEITSDVLGDNHDEFSFLFREMNASCIPTVLLIFRHKTRRREKERRRRGGPEAAASRSFIRIQR